MKIVIDEERMQELIRHILKNNFETNDPSELKDLENKVMEAFDENKLFEFLYQYITLILKDIKN